MSRSQSLRRRAVSDLKCAPKRAHSTRRLQAAIEALEIRVLLSTYTVNTFLDQTDAATSKTVSLRDAIALAAANPGPDTIHVPAGHYDLKYGELHIIDTSGAVTIQSIDGTAIINGQDNGRVLEISAQSTVSGSGLEITNGRAYSYMGEASDSGILDEGKLVLTGSTISGNQGGAIYVTQTGSATLKNDSISNNDGDAVTNYGAVTLSDDTIANDDGGVTNYGAAVISDSTIASSNYAISVFGGSASLTNVTIADNENDAVFTSEYSGAPGNISLANCTLSQNGGGISLSNSIVCTIANSVIAGSNFGLGGDVSVSAQQLTSLGGNVIGDASGASGTTWLASDKVGTSTSPIDAALAPLANYGGALATTPLLAGGPARGAGVIANIPQGLTTDERGLPRVVSGKVDAGAVEMQTGPAIGLKSPPSQTVNVRTPITLGSFSESPARGPFTVYVNWGDNTGEIGYPVKQPGTIPAQLHGYSYANTYAVQEIVTDSNGNVSNQVSFNVTVVPAPAISIVVNTTKSQTDPAGSPTVSLQDAVARAETAGGPAAITFNPKLFTSPQTITLSDLPTNAFGLVSVTGPKSRLTLNITETQSYNGPPSLGGLTLTNLTILDEDIPEVGPVVIEDCTVTGGVSSDGPLTVSDSTISSLAGLDALDATEQLTITNSAVVGNVSGGNNATMMVENSTIVGEASGGNNATMIVEDSTIVGDIDDQDANGSSLVIEDSTVIGGDSGVFFAGDQGSTLTLSNSVIEDSIYGYGGAVNSLGHNFVENGSYTGGWVASDQVGTDENPLNPKLSPLGDYGGDKPTEFPLPGSPLLGAGSISLIPTGLTTDERGFARVVKGTVDIGAFQTQDAAAISITPPAVQHVTVGASQAIHLGTVADPGVAGPFTVVINWGDGSPVMDLTQTSAGALGTPTHAYTQTGDLTGTITIADKDGDVSAITKFSVVSVPAPAISIVVNSTADAWDPLGSSRVTLRDAIDRADAAFGPVSITFDPKVFASPQTIYLSQENVPGFSHNVFGDITITGSSRGVTIESDLAQYIGSYYNNLAIGAGVDADISNITFLQLALNSAGNVRISHCVFKDNSVGAETAGIENSGDMVLQNSTITGDTAYETPGMRSPNHPGYGGAIENLGTMTVQNCNLSDNNATIGGAVCNAGTILISNSILSGNSAQDGGAIWNNNSLTLVDSTVSGNAGASYGAVANTSFEYAGPEWGGPYLPGITPTATITNSTISGNTGSGGIENDQTLSLVNSTIANNSTSYNGGGINNAGKLNVYDSTIAGNTSDLNGGGIYNDVVSGNALAFTIANTIVANNIAMSLPYYGPTVLSPDISGAVTSLGHNLIGQTDGSTGWTKTDLTGTSAKPLNPDLSKLWNFGGLTQTMVLESGSPAIDAGSVSLIPKGVTTDQRGLPRTLGGKVDIGAVEVGSPRPYAGAPAPFGVIQAENFDYGGQGVGYYNPSNINKGGVYRPNEGVGIGAISAANGGGYYVGWTVAGETLNYTVTVAATGTYTLNFSVASLGVGGTFHLNVDGINATGKLTVPNTGGWYTYQIVSKAGVKLTAGTHVLQLVIDTVAAGGAAGNFDWFSATKTS